MTNSTAFRHPFVGEGERMLAAVADAIDRLAIRVARWHEEVNRADGYRLGIAHIKARKFVPQADALHWPESARAGYLQAFAERFETGGQEPDNQDFGGDEVICRLDPWAVAFWVFVAAVAGIVAFCISWILVQS